MDKFIDVPTEALEKICRQIIKNRSGYDNEGNKNVLKRLDELDILISKRPVTEKIVNGKTIKMVKLATKEYNWFKDEYELPF